MPDSDPPDEVCDGESPCDWNFDAPDSYTFAQQIGDSNAKNDEKEQPESKNAPPKDRRFAREHNRADLFADRLKSCARSDNREWIVGIQRPCRMPLPFLDCAQFSQSELRIWIAKLSQIGGARPSVQLGVERIVELFGFEFGYAIVRVILIAKNNCLRRACLHACGLNFLVADESIFDLRSDLRLLDALHAIGTFLHHAAATYAYVRIPLHFPGLVGPVLEQHEIEAAYLIRTVIRAVAGTDTAVVNHVVQPLGTVICRLHRTHQLTWRVLALHARNGHVIRGGEARVGFIVSVDPQPVHCAAS